MSDWIKMKSSPKEIVNQIREEFGYNDRDPEPTGRLVEGFRNALQMLSKELYAYDGHFILELIQNADDNKYEPNVEPMIDIQVGKDGIVVRNNEIGFTAANVQAICHLGESTKRELKSEATGEKGIGFKAVFKVSRRPEIHSNGFHFCFDTIEHGELGMVLPEWLPDDHHRLDPGITTVVLPSDLDLEAPKDLPSQFVAELPLFLRRLRHLKISDSRTGESVELRRSDRDGLTSIDKKTIKNGRSATTKHLFFRHELKCDVSDIKEEKRKGILTTVVVVAIPLRPDESMDRSEKRQFYAFLPVKDSGLNFVVHADFILNASREDILKDRKWNLRIRHELGKAIADAVVAMQQRNSVGYTALCVLCDPIVIPDQFLKAMMVRAIECLGTAECIPRNGGGWLKPQDAICPDQAGLADLLSDEEIFAKLKKAFVNKLAKQLEEPLNVLKVEQFTFDTLLKICSNHDWIKSRSNSWLQSLFEKLATEAKSPARLEKVKQTPLFRLSDGRHVTAKERTIYRSLKGEHQYGFEGDLYVLHPHLVGAKLKKSTNSPIESLLERVGIKDANPVNIIDDYILPKHGENEFDSKTLIAHAHFLLDNFKTYIKTKQSPANPLSDLANIFHLLSNQTMDEVRHCYSASQLYIGKAFGDPNDMEGLLGSEIMVIAKDYLSCHTPPEPQRWRELFLLLGANKMPRLLNNAGDYELSPELENFVERNDPDMNGRLLILLESNYDIWTRARLTHEKWGSSSAFCDALGNLALKVRGGEPRQARHVFLDNEGNRTVFGQSVSYLDWKLKNEEFVEQIGIVCRPSVEQVLLQLEQLSELGLGNKDQVVQLYRFLEQHWGSAAAEIRLAFTKKPIVFYTKHDHSTALGSTFLKDCCWSLSMKLQPYCSVIALKPDWDQHRDFFRQHLSVAPKLSGEDWLEVIASVEQSKLVAEKQGELMLVVYKELDDLLKKIGDESKQPPQWILDAKDQSIIFTSKGDWRAPVEEVYEADDEKLASSFDDSDKVRFVGVPNDQLPQLQHIFEALRIRKVSAATRFPPDWDAGNANAELKQRIKDRWIHIVRIIYAADHRGYDSAKRGGQLLQIRDIEVRVYWPLEMDVSIANEIRRHPFPTHLHSQAGRARLLVDSNDCESWIHIAECIVRFLNVSNSCADLISMVLAAKDEAEIERIFKQKKLAALPQSELDSLSIPYVDEDEDWEATSKLDQSDNTQEITRQNARESSTSDGPVKAKNLLKTTKTGRGGSQKSGHRNDQRDSGAAPSLGVSRSSDLRVHVPPTAPDGATRQQQAPRPKQRRLVSYVEAVTDASSSLSDSEQQEQRSQTDEAAIAFVMQQEIAAGRKPKEMDHYNPGYDIESIDPRGGSAIYIEVKGIAAEWGELGVMLSRAQFDFARMNREKAWLYVIEYAIDPIRRRIWRIQDPATKVNKFGFDYKWRDLCEEASKLSDLEAMLREGAPYALAEGSLGNIVRVETRGSMYTVVVKRDDGIEVTRTMSLEMHCRAIGGVDGESRTSD